MSRKFLRKRVSVPIAAACLAVTASLSVADENKLITSSKNSFWQEGTVTEGSGGTTITVNPNSNGQKWLGFAGCFNEAGWDALNKLSDSDKAKALKLLFDKEDGIGFEWGRIPIGASDYALKRYSLAETADDFTMQHFSIERDKNYLIPFIKAAQALKPNMQFWASAWTPPAWMKEGADPNSNGYDGGMMKNQPKYLAANALYTAKFCEAYKGEGIPIKAVCPQNEPGYLQHYPTCGWGFSRGLDDKLTGSANAEYFSTYIADYLKDTLKERSPETDIWLGTLSNGDTYDAYYNGTISKAKNIIKAVGTQWNNSPKVAKAIQDGYITIQTEHQCGNYPWASGGKVSTVEAANENTFLPNFAPNNYAYGIESWKLIKKWIDVGVNVYSAWNMVLDTVGKNLDKTREWPQNALLAVNTQSKKLNITPYYYVMRHIAQYVDSGATYLKPSGNALAFKNLDGSIITVVYNENTSQAQTTISISGGKSYKVTIPGQGWATLAIGLKTVSTKENARNQFNSVKSIKVTSAGDAYKVSLPSRESGRVELLTISGRVLETRAIPQGCSELSFSKNASYSGMMLVRAVYGAQTLTTRLFNAQ